MFSDIARYLYKVVSPKKYKNNLPVLGEEYRQKYGIKTVGEKVVIVLYIE